jgi:hypothetical protein
VGERKGRRRRSKEGRRRVNGVRGERRKRREIE